MDADRVVVIGGGPGGRIAALHLANAGSEVLLVEEEALGGQCLHSRCMVVCALNDVARTLHQCRTLAGRGVMAGPPEISFPYLLAGIRDVVGRIGEVIRQETLDAGVEVLAARGRLEEGRVFVDGAPVEADAVIIATGSSPALPAIEGRDLAGVITHRDISSLDTLPGRMVIVGGGVSAAEFAYIFRQLGSEVTLVSRRDFLRGMDDRIRDQARRDLEGVAFLENTPITGVAGSDGRATGVRLADGSEVDADTVLFATGVAPNTDATDGLSLGAAGEILVDERMQTSRPGIYACGDVIGPPYLTPAAWREGLVAAENILGRPATISYTGIPRTMHLSMEYAHASCADERSTTFTAPGPAGPGTFWRVGAGGTGLVQVSADAGSGRITGVASVSPAAGHTVPFLAFLMQEGITTSRFADFFESHPDSDGLVHLLKYMDEWRRSPSPSPGED